MKDLLDTLVVRFSALWRRQDGQTMAEYGIILVVLAIVAAAAFALLAGDIGTALGKVGDKLTGP